MEPQELPTTRKRWPWPAIVIAAMFGLAALMTAGGVAYMLLQGDEEPLPEFQSASMEGSELEYHSQNEQVRKAEKCYDDVMGAYRYLDEWGFSEQAMGDVVTAFGGSSWEWRILQENLRPFHDDYYSHGSEVATLNLQLKVAESCTYVAEHWG